MSDYQGCDHQSLMYITDCLSFVWNLQKKLTLMCPQRKWKKWCKKPRQFLNEASTWALELAHPAHCLKITLLLPVRLSRGIIYPGVKHKRGGIIECAVVLYDHPLYCSVKTICLRFSLNIYDIKWLCSSRYCCLLIIIATWLPIDKHLEGRGNQLYKKCGKILQKLKENERILADFKPFWWC